MPVQNKSSWNFRKADWPKFTSKLEEFCDLIKPCSLNNMELILERDALCAEVQSNNTEDNRRKYVNSCQKVEEEISLCKRQKWGDFCATLDPRKTSQHWNIIKTLNNRVSQPPQDAQETNSINRRGKLACTNSESANILAEFYANNSKLAFSKTDKATRKTTRRLIKGSFKPPKNNIFSYIFTIEELDSALLKLDPKKAPGADLIFGSMIQHFGEKAKRKSISLTSTLCKLMERMIHSRIMNWLIRGRNLHFYQTAYRAHHSTVDQLFYLCQSIIDVLQKKPHEKTVAVFLDLSSAFDCVWRHKLVHIAHEVGIEGHALVWINDFLRNRHFSVRFNGELSKTHRTYAGVPQGSVLSPFLFLLYMNTIDAYIHKSTKIARYADDIAIWSTNHDLKTSQKFLNFQFERHCNMG
ncbi:putative RNA-directed DNA polymerase like protein [Argiope bruennichi]|uniref:Putative RNA-directed DNA polymerase like protein n=1 Tax=Argiope bruennichi TaxID=94029 RepID=A0A8T0EYX2_ARGBR|nr:putative RNA-directed DNA polymerase like protein [Argiope bruennichi]